jgi:hypothetical protein
MHKGRSEQDARWVPCNPHNVRSFRHDTHVKHVYGKLDMHQREIRNRA